MSPSRQSEIEQFGFPGRCTVLGLDIGGTKTAGVEGTPSADILQQNISHATSSQGPEPGKLYALDRECLDLMAFSYLGDAFPSVFVFVPRRWESNSSSFYLHFPKLKVSL
jgi:hypothetical protein